MPQSDQELKVTKTLTLHGGTSEGKRQEILDYFHKTFDLYEKLFESMTEEAFYQRADPLRHPLIFYFGHTATFFINKMCLAKLVDRVNPEFECLFAIGVDEMSWDDMLTDGYVWPPLADVQKYRDAVRERVDTCIRKASISVPLCWESPMWSVLMGIEHERIHLETSAVLIRQLNLSVLKGPSDFWAPYSKPREGDLPSNELLPVISETTSVTLGRPVDHEVYGWDLDYGTRTCAVPPFKASKFLVTNKDFLEFVQDSDGYSNPRNWTEPEGERYLRFKQKKEQLYPLFWISQGEGKYKLRLMLEEIDMPWDWPVEVNNLEAKAYCNWLCSKSGKPIRLPTEEEFRVMRLDIDCDQHTWEKAPGNINLEHYCSSTPVDLFPPSPKGFYDIIGNVWHHTETPLDPYTGFRVHPYYDDFSVPTFDLQHNSIQGGSWISTGNEATLHARYGFRRHFYQFAGFRYVESDHPVEIRNDVYERDDMVNHYNEAHYGPGHFGQHNFAKQMAEKVFEVLGDRPSKRALDLGCAVGRSTFELARGFDHTVGLDFSARFIRAACSLQEKGTLTYPVKTEGDLTEFKTSSLEKLGLEQFKDKCEFLQADACNLDPRFSDYDVVLCANLVDRLYAPSLFLEIISSRVNVGGLLILTSPYLWDEEYTPKESWLGGYVNEAGENVSTLEGLKEKLTGKFKLTKDPEDIHMVVRETSRKFQYSVVEMTVWERIQ